MKRAAESGASGVDVTGERCQAWAMRYRDMEAIDLGVAQRHGQGFRGHLKQLRETFLRRGLLSARTAVGWPAPCPWLPDVVDVIGNA